MIFGVGYLLSIEVGTLYRVREREKDREGGGFYEDATWLL